MTRIPVLPDEIIVHLMSYLSLPDRKNARLVCRRWCELSFSTSLIKDDITVLPYYSSLDRLSFERKYFNIKIKKINVITPTPIQFWARCGSHVKSIEMFLIDNMRCYWLQEVFANTPNLEFLLLSSYDENDQTRIEWRDLPMISPTFESYRLPKLVSLDLLHVKDLKGEHFCNMVENVPLLKRLSLEWLESSGPSDLQKALVDFAKRQTSILKELNFSYSTSIITDEFFRPIVSSLGPQLTGLYLRKCTALSDSSLRVISKFLPNLKEVDVSMCSFTDAALYKFIQNLKHLTHISLVKTLVGDSTLPLLASMNQLRAIELSQSKQISPGCFLFTFSQQDLPKLADLRLDYLRMTDAIVCNIVLHLPNLKYLYLNGCVSLTDLTLQAIIRSCPILRSLSLQNCIKIIDVSGVNGLKGLIHLDLHGCRKVSNKSVAKLKLLELQSMDLSCTQVVKSGFEAAVANCPSLQDVYLDVDLEDDVKNLRKLHKYYFKTHFGLSRFTAEPIFDS